MITKVNIESFLEAFGPSNSWQESVSRYIPLVPIFALNSIFKLGSLVIVAVILRWNSVLLFIGLTVLIAVTYLSLSKCHYFEEKQHLVFGPHLHFMNLSWITETEAFGKLTPVQTKENIMFYNIFWLTIHCLLLFVLNLLVTLCSDAEMSVFLSPIFLNGTYKLSSLGIVENIHLLHIVSGSVLASGFLLLAFFYFQVIIFKLFSF